MVLEKLMNTIYFQKLLLFYLKNNVFNDSILKSWICLNMMNKK